MREWECVQLSHHKDIGQTIERWQRNGWRFHTYQAQGSPTMVNHYLLFERGSEETIPPSVKAAVAAAAAI
ncbi:MAG: hypothetical protein JSV76_02440 [Candidatus Bathyarchaeota archaeon]|nr:MAG: hypothetical protein JSV76_02440 [Candidatus Bathyarchaeota archaeon]